MWEGVPNCGKVFPSVGVGVPVWEGVPQCGCGCPSVGGCSPVLERVSQCGRVCPYEGECSCICEVWMCLSHVHMMDTQEHLITGRYGEGLCGQNVLKSVAIV